jgi:Asp-tRNA(Asn)/Glu-tRNA(Gln) amidotransferase C subunit
MERNELTTYLSYPDPHGNGSLERIYSPLPVRPEERGSGTDFHALMQVADGGNEGTPAGSLPQAQLDQQGMRQLDALKNIGLSEEEMEMLRKRLQEDISTVIDQVFAVLVKPAEPAARAADQPQEMDLRTLMARSRDNESVIRNGRELAEDLVMGSLVNWGNEVWDPNDPDTSVASSGNLLIKMLQQ